jgi:tRNA(Ile)-lysidine synthase
MARLFALSGFDFAMAHVNFGLRGMDSEADEAFVRSLGDELGVEVFVERVDVAQYRKQNGVSVQMAARSLRYDFFHRLMKERGFGKLATAHHANDNLEHFFVYLYRGNTAVAWRGIWAEQGEVIRPLLGFLKADLADFLLVNGWGWREDRSNAGTGYLRNKVRHFLMPGMDEFAREFYGLSQQQQVFFGGEQAREAEAWASHSKEVRGGWFVPSVYRTVAGEAGVMDRLMGMGFSRSMVTQALAVKQVGKWFDGSLWRLWVGRQGWMISPKEWMSPSAVVMVWEDGAVVEWGGYRIGLRKVTAEEKMDGVDTYYFGLGVSARSWVLRGWVNGDEMTGFGGVHKKVSDWFVDEKIESFAKPFVPLLVGAEGVLCAMGVRRSSLHPVVLGDAGFWALSWEVL